jgi:hypothetical protein
MRLIQEDDPEEIRKAMQFYLGGGEGNPLGVTVSIPKDGATASPGVVQLDVSMPVQLQSHQGGD